MNEISVYIHWPFCSSKCPYCDFNSHVSSSIDTEGFINGYITEIEYFKEILQNKVITTIFFGGGTPSLAPPKFFERVISKLAQISELANEIEITCEANPSSVEYNKFVDFKSAGINRVSIGIQSFDQEELRFLGRQHSVEDALHAIRIAQNTFDRYSFDLIYALPKQSLTSWKRQLKNALKLADGHLSLYQLTIEKGTKFFTDHAKGKFQMPQEEISEEFYTATNNIMSDHEFDAYEISNYAVKGNECKHNMVYWNYGQYLGIGPGAHGRYRTEKGNTATMMTHSPQKWLDLVKEQGHGLQQCNILTEQEEYEEMLIMGLRLKDGISKIKLRNTENMQFLLKQGLLMEDNFNIYATDRGRLVLNNIITYMI